MSPRRTRHRRRGGRSSGPALCRGCGGAIAWFKLRGSWRMFRPRPVVLDGRQLPAAAYPVEGKQAWPTQDLVEELMGRYACDRAEAEEHTAAMPWHVLHACPPSDSPSDPTADTARPIPADVKEPTH